METEKKRFQRKRFLTKTLIVAVLMVAVVASVFAAQPTTTHASAYGIQYWGAFTVNIGGQSVGIPSGQLCALDQR